MARMRAKDALEAFLNGFKHRVEAIQVDICCLFEAPGRLEELVEAQGRPARLQEAAIPTVLACWD